LEHEYSDDHVDFGLPGYPRLGHGLIANLGQMVSWVRDFQVSDFVAYLSSPPFEFWLNIQLEEFRYRDLESRMFAFQFVCSTPVKTPLEMAPSSTLKEEPTGSQKSKQGNFRLTMSLPRSI